jgi:CTP:molybdopterin cytidylyltransferase MocA
MTPAIQEAISGAANGGRNPIRSGQQGLVGRACFDRPDRGGLIVLGDQPGLRPDGRALLAPTTRRDPWSCPRYDDAARNPVLLGRTAFKLARGNGDRGLVRLPIRS